MEKRNVFAKLWDDTDSAGDLIVAALHCKVDLKKVKRAYLCYMKRQLEYFKEKYPEYNDIVDDLIEKCVKEYCHQSFFGLLCFGGSLSVLLKSDEFKEKFESVGDVKEYSDIIRATIENPFEND